MINPPSEFLWWVVRPDQKGPPHGPVTTREDALRWAKAVAEVENPDGAAYVYAVHVADVEVVTVER